MKDIAKGERCDVLLRPYIHAGLWTWSLLDSSRCTRLGQCTRRMCQNHKLVNFWKYYVAVVYFYIVIIYARYDLQTDETRATVHACATFKYEGHFYNLHACDTIA